MEPKNLNHLNPKMIQTLQKRKKRIYIPEGSNPLNERFINYIMKKGKKNTARKIFIKTLEKIREKTNGKEDAQKLLEKAIENTKPLLEVRPQRIGGAVYQIPRDVKPDRQIQLSFRWILGAARSKKGEPMEIRLANEIIEATNNTGAAIKKKEDSHRMAQANKAFAHFAKY